MPRVYRKGFPQTSLFLLTGSALPRAGVAGLFSAAITFAIAYLVPRDYLEHLFEHPYPFQPFAYITGFALVFRTQVAYNRYWEAASDVALMASKWGDAIVECLGFDEFPRTAEGDTTSLERRRRFQILVVQRFSLMHALALQYLRRDDDLSLLCKASPHDASFPLADSVDGASRRESSWRRLPVLGGVTDAELERLEPTADRVAFAFSQVGVAPCTRPSARPPHARTSAHPATCTCHMHMPHAHATCHTPAACPHARSCASQALALINGRRADGGMGVEAPVLSRAYQLISDGMLGFRQVHMHMPHGTCTCTCQLISDGMLGFRQVHARARGHGHARVCMRVCACACACACTSTLAHAAAHRPASSGRRERLRTSRSPSSTLRRSRRFSASSRPSSPSYSRATQTARRPRFGWGRSSPL